MTPPLEITVRIDVEHDPWYQVVLAGARLSQAIEHADAALLEDHIAEAHSEYLASIERALSDRD